MSQAALQHLQARMQAIRSEARLAQELEALGIDEHKARRAAAKAVRFGCGLCMAKNRRGLPCIALGSGAGGRCRFHGGLSTGPKTPEGRQRALQALARGRLRAADNRRRGPAGS